MGVRWTAVLAKRRPEELAARGPPSSPTAVSSWAAFFAACSRCGLRAPLGSSVAGETDSAGEEAGPWAADLLPTAVWASHRSPPSSHPPPSPNRRSEGDPPPPWDRPEGDSPEVLLSRRRRRMPDSPSRSKLPTVTIYTDGGADPNPGPGGWGAVLLHPVSGSAQELRGGEARTTNNRMELTAAIRALEALRQPCRVEMHTDSQYLRRGVSEWLPGWIARGWRRKEGVLQNEDLWRRLADAVGRHEVHWNWVKGHAGDVHNERADQLATAAIREQRAAAGAAAAAAGVPAAALPEYEAFLRVSMTPQGGGWAALLRRAGAGTAVAGGAVAGASTEVAGAASSSPVAPPAGVPEVAGADSGETVLSGGLPPGAAATANALDLAAAAAGLEALPARASVAGHPVSDDL